ncbi:DMT family transporter [Virgifigura deserti]|uniref:DMT family transporter n=1 Tax=Virgifigura deserti TaxID=2268457 RepID=UPI003CCC2D8B
MVLTYLYLVVAISFEVAGTSALQASQQFTRPVPTLLMVLCYAGTFYFLSLTLRVLPVGIAYAIWAGLGIVLISAIAFIFYRQKLDLAAIIGLAFIIAGVVIVNVFSKSLNH